VYEVGEFVHVPVDADSVLPTCAVPEIVGTDVFTGAGALCKIAVMKMLPHVVATVRPGRTNIVFSSTQS
jgi:hypothetical protein